MYKQREDTGFKSIFGPYLDILPEKADNFPVFFSDDELKMLEGSEVKKEIIIGR